VNYQNPPLPTHDDEGSELVDRIRNILPVGTVEVLRFGMFWYLAVNNNQKTVMIPGVAYLDDYVDGYVYTFDDNWPTHDWLGNELADNVIQRLPFGARNIKIYGGDIRQISYHDINGDPHGVAL
jgi:hypothetical protein